MKKKNLVLIGMPGAGKSTLGVLLAKKLGMDFVDTDIAIQKRAGQTLQQILNENDYLFLRQLEEEVLLDIDTSNEIIATGGSAVYSEIGMAHLSKSGIVVYLKASPAVLKQRITDYETRGIACKPGQSFDALYQERTPLYERHADICIECDERDSGQLADELANRLAPLL